VSDDDPEEVVELPIDGTLDLHAFAPRDVKDLVGTYLDECRVRGILEVRIVHGKGTGTLRRIVHSVLEKRDDVDSFALAPAPRGGWGATLVMLKRR
jgi:DNA-nicking Smr family endonuclease